MSHPALTQLLWVDCLGETTHPLCICIVSGTHWHHSQNPGPGGWISSSLQPASWLERGMRRRQGGWCWHGYPWRQKWYPGVCTKGKHWQLIRQPPMEVLVHPTLHRDLGTVVLRLSGQHSQRSRPWALWGHVLCSLLPPRSRERKMFCWSPL